MTTKTKKSGPTIVIRKTKPTTTVVYETYWNFAARRQDLYFERLKKTRGPWTKDRILAEHRFTNAYRAADRVSQFLIRDVIYENPQNAEDTVFRTLLFKLFNKIETWDLLERTFGEISIKTFDAAAFDAVLSEAFRGGIRIYSAAYIMPNAPRHQPESFKHRTHLDLLAYIISEGVHRKILESKSMAELYKTLLSLPSIGPFLAYQYAIDLMYSEHLAFSENDFVQPGPGAINGLSKCFSSPGDYSLADLIAWVADRQENEFFSRNLDFQTLWGRPLHLIDCQNLFCEVDKYARVAHPEFSEITGRSRIKQKYSPSGAMPRPWFPPKWGLNIADSELAFDQPMLDAEKKFASPKQSSFEF